MELAADGEERLHAYADNLQLFEELGNDRIDAINSVVAPNTYAFCEFNVEEAQEASSQGSSLVKFLILGLVVGLLLSLCGIALYGFVKRPIQGSSRYRGRVRSACFRRQEGELRGLVGECPICCWIGAAFDLRIVRRQRERAGGIGGSCPGCARDRPERFCRGSRRYPQCGDGAMRRSARRNRGLPLRLCYCQRRGLVVRPPIGCDGGVCTPMERCSRTFR